MMKRSRALVITFIALFGSLLATAQNTDDPVIMTVDGQAVTKSEFENIFKKNNQNTEVTKESLDEYLELFTNFKLKVRAAEELGMDTVQRFVAELNGYRSQLRRPYMVDNQKNDELLRQAYARSTEEVRASHVLIKVEPNAAPEDTAKAYAKILEVRKRLLAGDDFKKVAADESQDPSVRKNYGDLGYFSAFQMVYAFENAAFNTEVGEVSDIIRTRFGYHVLKVFDKREARGQVKVAHVMTAAKAEDSDEKRDAAKKRIFEIYEELKKGGDFAELARRHSDDKNSAKNGGELPAFGAGRMVQEFEDASFGLAADGNFSEPFETSYGWHIVKRIERVPVASYEELEKELKQKVQRDTRSQLSKASFIAKLKKEYNFQEYPKAWKSFMKQMDTTVYAGTWAPEKPKKLKKVMYTFNNEDFTQMDLAEYIMAEQRKEGNKDLSLSAYAQRKYNAQVNAMVVEYEDSQLETKYPQFRMLMKEYRDGILLFELTNEKVWNKAVKDTTGLKDFYEKNKNNHMWDQRLDATVYTCADMKTAKMVMKMKKRGVNNGTIVSEINKESALNLKIESDKYEKGASPKVDAVAWKEGFSEIKMVDGQAVFVEVKKVLSPEPKALDEVRGLITAEYQDYLEKQWIEALRAKYAVDVDYDVLYSIK